jgi:hypothetical protein
MGQLMPAESPRIARQTPRYGPKGPEAADDRPQALSAPSGASCRRSRYRTVWDDLGYLHDHPTGGDAVGGCTGCAERSSDSRLIPS